jgi:ketosteroid isomerase-like protein
MTDSSNLDLVRSIYANWERGDFSSAEWAHLEIEFVSARGLDPGSWTGLAGMREGERGLLDAFAGFRTRAEEFRELDDERVLVLSHQSGRGKRSGLELEQLGGSKGADLFHVLDGKVTKLVIYGNRTHALADLGLAPEGGPPDS